MISNQNQWNQLRTNEFQKNIKHEIKMKWIALTIVMQPAEMIDPACLICIRSVRIKEHDLYNNGIANGNSKTRSD